MLGGLGLLLSPGRLLTLCLTLGVVAHLLLYGKADWRAATATAPAF